ncbi:rod shape-determining protein MreD [Zunongwangia sp. F260]|uniref:Rod shape-determining protein MreD n=2 Tax=Autumnicola TaxID=3160927 RepID=A0ABU3CHC7_9FLAO|nr:MULTISPECIES: rod shape-determining protein MreD [unclassified Zunongwangia]MDT0645755.1 rod shape-determining protein MreD [Zunongwangia sp. F260]MDT0686210.1 rod shape-determining protein MreD [Zunongwangia sp. F225]
MNSSTLSNIARFFGLIFLQVLVLNNINFLGYINPYLYFLFVLLYPFNSNRSLFLLLSFLLGISIDIFEDSGGIHAAACLVAAYIRPNFLRFSFGISYDHQTLRLSATPFGARLSYIFLMVVIHHFILFSLEMFSFNHILLILEKTLYSSLFTIILIFLSLALFSKKYR